MGSYGSIILIVVMVIAFYFLIMRPQRRRQQQQLEMMNAIEAGSRVVTTTGIYATVIAVGDKQVVLETAPGNRVTMLKQAIGRVVRDGEEDESLAGYRAGTAAGSAAGSDLPPTSEESENQASGMAGGTPIQEYTPGSGPDFSAPAPSPEQHETAPWPPYGTPSGTPEENPSQSGEQDSSLLGESSLNPYEQEAEKRNEQDTKGRDSGR
jgi:preprotein translocase subunit YajC